MDDSEVKKICEELKAKRVRTGLPPLSREDRIQLLNEIYDGLLYFFKQCVITGTAKGTGSIVTQLEGARLEMDSWEKHGGGRGETQIIIGFMDPPKPKEPPNETGSNS